MGAASDASGITAAHVLREANGALQLSASRSSRPTATAGAARRRRGAHGIGSTPPCAIVLPPRLQDPLHAGLPVADDKRNDALRRQLKDELEFPPDEAVIDGVLGVGLEPDHRRPDSGWW